MLRFSQIDLKKCTCSVSFEQKNQSGHFKGSNSCSRVDVHVTKGGKMTLGKLLVLKLIGLGIGCVAKFTTGSLFVFAVYQNAIKDTFNYTQREGTYEIKA